jgi:hypothetical protein
MFCKDWHIKRAAKLFFGLPPVAIMIMVVGSLRREKCDLGRDQN